MRINHRHGVFLAAAALFVGGAATFGSMRAWSSSGSPPTPPHVDRPVPPGVAVALSAVPADVLASSSMFLHQPSAAMASAATIDAQTAIERSYPAAPVQQAVLADNQHYDEYGVLQHQFVWAVEYPEHWTSIDGTPGRLSESVAFVDAVTGKLLFTASF